MQSKKYKTGGFSYAYENGLALVWRGQRPRHPQRHQADPRRDQHRLGAAQQDARRDLGDRRDSEGRRPDPRLRLRHGRCRVCQRPRRHQDRPAHPRSVHRELQAVHPQPVQVRCQGHLLQLHAHLRLDPHRPVPPRRRRLHRTVLREGQDQGRLQVHGRVHHVLH